MTARLRNILAFEDENAEWQRELAQFPNHVPRFATKDEAINFTKAHCRTHSNPGYPHLQHSITTLIDWNQIETILLPKIKEYERRWPSSASAAASSSSSSPSTSSPSSSSSEPAAPEPAQLCDPNDALRDKILRYAKSRLDLPIHAEMSEVSRMNTLRYLFFHMKCGIYVMIRNGQVAIFCPFVNKDYRNTWNGELKITSQDGSLEAYIQEKRACYPKMHINLLDQDQWWANGNILCNDYGSPEDAGDIQYWGDHFLLQLKDMFAELCRCRQVPSCEFFINKRDYPQLKFNSSLQRPMEPYGFIFDRDDRDPDQDLPLRRHDYRSYLPILSFYSSPRFADIPIPPTEDWEAATGLVYPASFKYTLAPNGVEVSNPRDLFTHQNLQRFDCPWGQKVNTAFFRGTATGGGVTIATNQRLHLAHICHVWSSQPPLNGQLTGAPYLDAKITGWNFRDKKISQQGMSFIRSQDFPFEGDRRKNFVEIYKQSTYKYLIYVEGHCAACRYGFMMQLGSVILKVESACVADAMWYFPLLQPYVDHIPIRADLSDLQEKLEWCHQHDAECQQIAAKAKEIYEKYISRDGLLDYLHALTWGMHLRWRELPGWLRGGAKAGEHDAEDEDEEVEAPQCTAGASARRGGCVDGVDRQGQVQYCLYCQEMKEKEKKERQEAALARRADAGMRQARSASLRGRMLTAAQKRPFEAVDADTQA